MSHIKLEHAEAVNMADFFPHLNILLEELSKEIQLIAETAPSQIVSDVWEELTALNAVLLNYYPNPSTELMNDEEANEMGRDVAIFTVLSRNFLKMQRGVAEAMQQRKERTGSNKNAVHYS